MLNVFSKNLVGHYLNLHLNIYIYIYIFYQIYKRKEGLLKTQRGPWPLAPLPPHLQPTISILNMEFFFQKIKIGIKIVNNFIKIDLIL